MNAPSIRRGFSTVAGGNLNDYLPYVNYGKHLSDSNLFFPGELPLPSL